MLLSLIDWSIDWFSIDFAKLIKQSSSVLPVETVLLCIQGLGGYGLKGFCEKNSLFLNSCATANVLSLARVGPLQIDTGVGPLQIDTGVGPLQIDTGMGSVEPSSASNDSLLLDSPSGSISRLRDRSKISFTSSDSMEHDLDSENSPMTRLEVVGRYG